VVVNGVTDQAAQPNVIRADAAARVAAHYFIPFDGAWKYLLINTNETVQSTFMGVGYDDSTWLGPSNGFILRRRGCAAGAKKTELSLFDGTGVNRIKTLTTSAVVPHAQSPMPMWCFNCGTSSTMDEPPPKRPGDLSLWNAGGCAICGHPSFVKCRGRHHSRGRSAPSLPI
jgi:hypothetical protein